VCHVLRGVSGVIRSNYCRRDRPACKHIHTVCLFTGRVNPHAQWKGAVTLVNGKETRANASIHVTVTQLDLLRRKWWPKRHTTCSQPRHTHTHTHRIRPHCPSHGLEKLLPPEAEPCPSCGGPPKAPQVSFNMSKGPFLPPRPSMWPFIWLEGRTSKQNTSPGGKLRS